MVFFGNFALAVSVFLVTTLGGQGAFAGSFDVVTDLPNGGGRLVLASVYNNQAACRSLVDNDTWVIYDSAAKSLLLVNLKTGLVSILNDDSVTQWANSLSSSDSQQTAALNQMLADPNLSPDVKAVLQKGSLHATQTGSFSLNFTEIDPPNAAPVPEIQSLNAQLAAFRTAALAKAPQASVAISQITCAYMFKMLPTQLKGDSGTASLSALNVGVPGVFSGVSVQSAPSTDGLLKTFTWRLSPPSSAQNKGGAK